MEDSSEGEWVKDEGQYGEGGTGRWLLNSKRSRMILLTLFYVGSLVLLGALASPALLSEEGEGGLGARWVWFDRLWVLGSVYELDLWARPVVPLGAVDPHGMSDWFYLIWSEERLEETGTGWARSDANTEWIGDWVHVEIYETADTGLFWFASSPASVYPRRWRLSPFYSLSPGKPENSISVSVDVSPRDSGKTITVNASPAGPHELDAMLLLVIEVSGSWGGETYPLFDLVNMESIGQGTYSAEWRTHGSFFLRYLVVSRDRSGNLLVSDPGQILEGGEAAEFIDLEESSLEFLHVRMAHFDLLRSVSEALYYLALPVVVVLWLLGKRFYTGEEGFWRSVVRRGFWGLGASGMIGYFLWLVLVGLVVTGVGLLLVNLAPSCALVPFLRMRPPFYWVWLLVIMILVYAEIFGELTIHRLSRMVGWMINWRRRSARRGGSQPTHSGT